MPFNGYGFDGAEVGEFPDIGSRIRLDAGSLGVGGLHRPHIYEGDET